ncbi:MAG: cupin domain-containing protein [Gammaproteobacteria bacterium]|nr:cupin domain-containing protein [Gammaproteobacteria bacterium]
MLTGELSAADFLHECWQKQPLLIRQALPGFHSPISPEDLFALACEENVESRLILETGGPQPWELRHGPFLPQALHALPDTHWTLLLQEMNKHLPEAAGLVTRFDFIPHWRVDDIMVSISPCHGSVGPHVDSYDVFLLQVRGRKRWRIAVGDARKQALLPNLELRILKEFTPDREWVLDPGDMLYLPPGVAHHGVALEECETWSVGFRAPSHADMLGAMADLATETLDPDDRYRDPAFGPPTHPAEISPEVLAHVQQQVLALTSSADPASWFGRLVTENRSGLGPEPPTASVSPAQFRSLFQAAGSLVRDPSARFAYVRRPAGATTLFADGEAYHLDDQGGFAAPLIAERPDLPWSHVEPALDNHSLLDTLTELYNLGCLQLGERP